MNTRFGLICAAAVVMLAGSLHAAAPDGIVLTDTGCTAGSGNTAATINPKGTFTWASGVGGKIIWDYGTGATAKDFKLDTTGPLGGSKNINATDTKGDWGPLATAENLPNPIPKGYVLRVRILKLVGNEYVEETANTIYQPLPPK